MLRDCNRHPTQPTPVVWNLLDFAVWQSDVLQEQRKNKACPFISNSCRLFYANNRASFQLFLLVLSVMGFYFCFGVANS